MRAAVVLDGCRLNAGILQAALEGVCDRPLSLSLYNCGIGDDGAAALAKLSQARAETQVSKQC
jgi:hypothetical protein